MTHAQLLTIGETMALVAPTTPVPLEGATDFLVDAAGAESNLASACAGLGVRSAWVSAVGDDPLGRRIVSTISARGVDVSHVRTVPGAPTGVYFKDPGADVHYYRAGSAASRMGPDLLEGLPLQEVQILHLTGITPALSASCTHLVDSAMDAARHAGTTISFDINFRSALWARKTAAPVLLSLATRSDIVFVGLDEAQALWGCERPEDVRVLIPGGTLVVKNGEVGATEYTGTEGTFVAAPQVDVVEVVGAGDAFAAGYLAAHLGGAPAQERLQAGHRQAGHVLTSTADFAFHTN